MLRLDLSSLKAGHNRLKLTADPAALGLSTEAWPEPIELDLDVDKAGDQITLRGKARTRIDDLCGRCVQPFRGPLEFDVTLYADRAGSGGRLEKELAEDEYMIFHDGRGLVLDEEVREAALLARPMTSLCREDCRGICPRCGADLNEEACRCPTPQRV